MKKGQFSNTYRSLFKENSSKSLSRYKPELIEHRASQITRQILNDPIKKKIQNNNFIYSTNPSTHIPKKQLPPKPEEDLKKQIRLLEQELKKKISESSILNKFLKTKNNSELSHIDIYLEMRRIEELTDKKEEQIKHLNNIILQHQKKEQKLQKQIDQQQKMHLENIVALGKQFEEKYEEQVQNNQKYKHESEEMILNFENDKILMEEIKNKNKEYKIKMENLSEELQMERSMKGFQQLKLKQQFEQQLQSCKQNYEDLKDQNEKITLRLKEAEEMYQELDRNSIKQVQHLHQQYQKSFKDYKEQEKNKKQLIRSELIKDKNKRQEELNTFIQQLELTNQKLNHNLNLQKQKNKNFERINKQLEAMVADSNQVKQKCMLEVSKVQQKYIHLTGEVKILKFQKEQKDSIISKIKSQKSNIEKIIQNLEEKLFTLSKDNENLNKRYEEVKKTSESNKTLQKLNNKMHGENYKALGRLIQLSNRIKGYISQEFKSLKEINEEELGEVVSHLGELLDKFIKKCYQSQKKKCQSFLKEKIEINREFTNILEQCKHFIQDQSIELLFSQYLIILKDKKHYCEIENDQRREIYQKVIENLMSLNSLKFYSSENASQSNQNYKDSLESTHQIKNSHESHKKLPKKSLFIEQKALEKRNYKRSQVNQVQNYNYPLKNRQFSEDFDKENVDMTNKKYQSVENSHYEMKDYSKEIKERFSSKGEKQRARKSEADKKADIEKKYFR